MAASIRRNSKLKCFMKRIVKLCVCLLMVSPLVAQQPEVGFIRLVNLVAGGEDGNVNFSLDGQDLYKPGYKLGQKTGGMGFKAGSYKLGVKKPGCKAAERGIKIENGLTQTFIAYGAPVRDELGEITGWEIKITSLSQKTPEHGYIVTLISLCESKELAVTIVAEGTPDPIKEVVPKMKAHSVKAGKPQGGVRVAVGETVVAGFYTDDPGNYVVLIYEDKEGNKKAIHYYDPKFLIAG